MGDAERLKKRLKPDRTPDPEPVWLSTGSCLLNLACSGRAQGGLKAGHVYLFVGDSSAGKTVAAMTALAEASIAPKFRDHRLVVEDAEGGMLMDVGAMFGKRLAERLEVVRHPYLDDFYAWLDAETRTPGAAPMVLVLDSMDALEPRAQEEKRREKAKDPNAAGSYGTAKAKMNSENLGWVTARMRDLGGVLIIICQSRSNIGFGAAFNPDTRSGGKALKFFSTTELWFKVREVIKTPGKVRGKNRDMGVRARVQVKKNRQSGRVPAVEFPIYWSHGIDDLGSCVDYLIDEQHWAGDKTKVEAPEFEFSGKKDALVAKVEEEDLALDLHLLVAKVWREIEDASRVRRRKKYE